MITPIGRFIANGLSETGIIDGEDGLTFSIADIDPPHTLVNVPPGNYTTAQSIEFTINEPGITIYRLNGGVETIYSGPITIFSPSLFEYHSIDTAGNVEPYHELYYDVDISLTKLSVDPGYYTETKTLVLSNEVALPIHYSVNGGVIQLYSTPIELTDDTQLTYYTEGEKLRHATFAIDLNPLVITTNLPLPAPRKYRYIEVEFNLNKPGQVFYASGDAPYTLYTGPFMMDAGNKLFKYYGVSDGRTYPVVTAPYIVDPSLRFVNMSPTPLASYQTPTFMVTLSKVDPTI